MVEVSRDELVEELLTWAGRVAAGEARLLEVIAECDERMVWSDDGMASCAAWLSWRIGLDPGAARERVRVARALRAPPLIAASLAEARVSYAQVRAITRVATAADEAEWVELAGVSTAAQLERLVRGMRRAQRLDQTLDEAREEAQTTVRQRYDADGFLVVTIRVAPLDIPAVEARLEQAQKAEQADRDAALRQVAAELKAAAVESADVSAETSGPSAPPFAEPYEYVEPPYPELAECPPWEKRSPADQAALDAWHDECRARRAKQQAGKAWAEHVEQRAWQQRVRVGKATLGDALVRALTKPETLKPSKVQVLVDPLSGWARTRKGELLPPGLPVLTGPLRPLLPTDLTRHDQGRTQRLVTDALRGLLGAVDGERCRFPGCTRTRGLDAHHVVWWRLGGRTDLANLVLLCGFHHDIAVHREGFQLVLSPDRSLTVRTKDDIPVPHHPALPAGSTAQLTGPAYRSRATADRLDLGYAVSVLLRQAA